MELPSILDGPAVPKPKPPAAPPPPITAGIVLEAIAWIVTIACTGLGILILVTGMASAQSAPQEAVVCALAMCFAVLPYVVARVVTHLRRL